MYSKYFKNLHKDIPSSIVVFLVALPLCLGIAQASNPQGVSDLVPLMAGIIAGVAGGIVVGLVSGSQLSVSGPAAGLTAVVGASLVTLQSGANPYASFLLAVVIAGAIQLLMGLLKLGVLGDYVPNAVIKGMLAAIGIILIMKQFPHLIGRDKDFEGDESFFQVDNENTFSEILIAMQNFTPGCAIIGITCIIILLLWETKWMKQTKIGQLMPAALIVVVVGSLIADYFESIYPSLSLSTEHLVHLPTSQAELNNAITFPFFEAISNYQIWIIALKLAIVASLETLLGIEAVDKLDPQRRISPPNRELIAQGAGNIVSGFFGGLPVTSVIVRSSANVTANAQTKVSTILHGLMLLFAVMLFPNVINKIPLSSLAAILIYTGYKLTKLNMFKEFYKKGWDQFVPFIVTIIAILLSDLLIGIMIGIGVGLFYMIRSNFRSSVLIVNDKHHYLIRLRKDVSFLNKPILKHRLSNIPENSILFIDATRADFIDKDIIDEINNFMLAAPAKNIKVEIKKSIHKPLHSLFNQL